MKVYVAAGALCGALMLCGAGCSTVWQSSPNSGAASRGGLMPGAPKDAWNDFASTVPRNEGLREVEVETLGGEGRRAVLSVPEDWTPAGTVWRPEDGKLNQIRVSYFTDSGPRVAWDRQKALGVHEAVHAEEKGGEYVLMVNHPSLKASILKVFIPDPKRPGDAYYYFECRAGFGDQTSVWRACKAAFESLKIES